MSRWLYNEDSIRVWSQDGNRPEIDPQVPDPKIIWWLPDMEEAEKLRFRGFQVGDFVGHGRAMDYCGLVSAFMNTVELKDWIKDPQFIRSVPEDLSLEENRPISWYTTAFVSLWLVWTEIFLAVVVDIYAPTIGFGCWSGSIVLFAILSTMSWVLQFKKRRGWASKVIAHVFNTLAIA